MNDQYIVNSIFKYPNEVLIRAFVLCALLAFCCSASDTPGTGSDTSAWRTDSTGMAFKTGYLIDPSDTRPQKFHMVRFSPDAWRFAVTDYQEHADNQRLSTQEWMVKTGAAFVINAGQYDTSFRHLGWFIRDSKNLGSRQHPAWKGVLCGQPKPDSNVPNMTILDLKHSPMTFARLPYQQAVQTLMLFDEQGRIRVNKSAKSARRCIVAESRDGFFYVIVTETDWTLWNLANALLQSTLHLKNAVSMDGGAQAQLAIRSPLFEAFVPRFQMALPCVICFFPLNHVDPD